MVVVCLAKGMDKLEGIFEESRDQAIDYGYICKNFKTKLF